MTMIGRALRGTIAVLSFLAAGWAGAGGIDTDRPDMADSAETLGPETFQLESGLLAATDGSGGAAYSLPLLLRFGLGDKFEARLGTGGPTLTVPGTGPSEATVLGDVQLGVKWNFFKGEGGLLEALGLLADSTWAQGAGSWGWDAWGVKLCANLDFQNDRGLGVNFGFESPDPAGPAPLEWGTAFSFGFPLGPDWSGYLETSASLPGGGEATWGLDGGVKRPLAEDLQLDAALGSSWTGASNEIFLTLGFSFRVGKGRAGD